MKNLVALCRFSIFFVTSIEKKRGICIMAKIGLQFHDYYFSHYKTIDTRGRKSALEKENTTLFDNYKFKEIIEKFIAQSNIIEKYNKYSLCNNDIIDMIFSLFYPHFEMAKDLLQYECIFSPNDFAENFLTTMSRKIIDYKCDFSGYFYDEDSNLTAVYAEDLSKYPELKNDLKDDVCRFLSVKKRTNSLSKIYDTIEKSDYSYFLFKQYKRLKQYKQSDKTEQERMMFYRKSYSGLIPYLMFINNRYYPSKLKSMLYNPIPYINTTEDKDETVNQLSKWYNELFNKNNKYYLELPGENKILEQQLLDTYFGCSVIGYILNHCNYDDVANIIEEVGFMGIFGLCDGTKKVIDATITEYGKDDNDIDYQETTYEDVNAGLLLFEDIMKIFGQFMYGFIRYLNIKGSYEKRIQYISHKAAVLEPPKISDDWKYLFSKNLNEFQKNNELSEESVKYKITSELIEKYACSIPSSFRDLYFFEEKMENVDTFLS